MRKKTVTYYHIGYKFEDGEENCIWHTQDPSSIDRLVQETWEEYGEKPVVWKVRVKI